MSADAAGGPDEGGRELPHMRELAASMSAVLDRCVWSQTMTHESLVTYLIEESYELIEAIETADADVLLEELGDVLLQIVFHAEIARRTASEGFSLDDVARAANDKMVRRHPHVFGDEVALTVEDVLRVWSAAKAREKVERTSALDGIPQGLPALVLADKVIGRARRAGVEIDADAPGPRAEDEAELGEQLFALVVAARERGLDPERALRAEDEAELGEQLFALVVAARERGLDPERALRAHLRGVQESIRESGR